MEDQPDERAEAPSLDDDLGQSLLRTPNARLTLDTTAGSVLHRLAEYHFKGYLNSLPAGLIYLTGVAATYVPLILTALLSRLPIAKATPELRLPFLYDWNVAFMFLASFPLLLVLTTTDQHVLATSLRRVQLDGIVSIPDDSAGSLSSLW